MHSSAETKVPGQSQGARVASSRVGVCALAAVGLLLAAASFRCIWNTDFWWQYKTGELVAKNGIPTQDVFSYTKTGAEWIELRWLFCYATYGLMDRFGAAGVVVMQWVVMTLTFGLLATHPAARKAPVTTAAVMMLAILTASQRFQCRPEQVTYLFLAVYIVLIEKIRAGRRRWAYALPVLQVVWTNAHTVFILGPLLVGAWLVDALLRRALGGGANSRSEGKVEPAPRLAAITLAATVGACFVNPYGWRGFLFPFLLASEIHTTAFKRYIAELAGTFSFSQTYSAVFFFEALLAVCVVSCLMNIRRLDYFLLISAACLGYLSVTAIRNLPLFSIAAVPLVVHNAASSGAWARLHKGKLRGCAAASIVAICLVGTWSMATDRFNAWQNDTNRFGLSLAPNRYPVAAAQFIRDNGLSGPVFNTMMEGSYLLSRDIRVYIDPRLEVYGERFFDDYMRMLVDGPFWEAKAKECGFRVVVVDLGSTALGILSGRSEWGLVFFDDVAAVFVHRAARGGVPVIGRDVGFEPFVERLRSGLPEVRPIADTPWYARVSSPHAAHRVAIFLLNMGQYALAEHLVDDAIRIDPGLAVLHATRAKIMDQLGRLEDAIAAYRAAAELNPDDAVTRGLLGRRLFTKNEFEPARLHLEASVAGLPDNAVNWALLCRIYLQQRKLNEALAASRRSIAGDPGNVMYRKDLAKVLAARREIGPMVDAFVTAARMAPEDCSIWRDLVYVLLEFGQPERAREVLGQVPVTCANAPEIVELRGRVPGGS